MRGSDLPPLLTAQTIKTLPNMQISLCTPRSCNLRHPQTLVSAWESDCWKLTRLTLPGLSPWGLPAALGGAKWGGKAEQEGLETTAGFALGILHGALLGSFQDHPRMLCL